jgi:predicted transcriptional regulator
LRRWDLSSDHPLTAPAYSEQRSAMAKQLGLGRKRSRARGRTRRSKP